MPEKKNIYVPDGMLKYWNELEKLADKEDRSVSYFVNQAVKEFIQNKEG